MTTRPAARTLAATGALGLALLLGACGGDDGGASDGAGDAATTSPAASPSAPASPEPTAGPTAEAAGTVVEVRIQGGDATPKGERVPVAVGETVTFAITSDVPGELHVHTTPESEIAFPAGTTEHTVTIETPGLVDVELHDPAVTLVQLEAR